MHTLVTRPEPQASQWAADLNAQGLSASALPLITISGPKDPAPVTQLWAQLSEQRLLMFVSPSAVEWFFRLRPDGALWPAGALAAAPGPGTATSLRQAGQALGLQGEHIISPAPSSAQFDSEALWPLLSPIEWAGQRVTVISGGDDTDVQGRTWLAEQWQSRGATVHALLSYQRTPGHWTAIQQAQAQDALDQPESCVWLLSSSQGIANLVQHHLPALSGQFHADLSQSVAISTHPKITRSAQNAGFGRIIETRPTLAAVVEARRSLQRPSG